MDAGKTILCPRQTTRWQLKYCVDVTDRLWGLLGILGDCMTWTGEIHVIINRVTDLIPFQCLMRPWLTQHSCKDFGIRPGGLEYHCLLRSQRKCGVNKRVLRLGERWVLQR